ncbi:ATPase WRNIP1 [Umbelopsis sp. PMI_123]|nr:ATPase WRNIP1 [Umbelopsis sp. PMI_123]
MSDTKSILVPCPVCSKLTPTWYINDHLDRDCSQLHKQETPKEAAKEVSKESRSPSQQTSRTQASPQQSFLKQGSSQQSSLKQNPLQTSLSRQHPVQQSPLNTGSAIQNKNESIFNIGQKRPIKMEEKALDIQKNDQSQEKQTALAASADVQLSSSDTDRQIEGSHQNATSSSTARKKSRIQSNVNNAMPLAAKVRPTAMEHFVGQGDLMGENGILRAFIKNNKLPSMILWGPPGSGKTTIARLISKMVSARCVELSATSHGAADVRKVAEEAMNHLKMLGQKTIVFLDEIHRFKRDQQDILLPHVERGTITLIGATTENPSFKLNSALLSRCRVFVLNRLSEEELYQIVARALCIWRNDEEEVHEETITNESDKAALFQLAQVSDGDARTALNILDIAVSVLPSPSSPLTPEDVKAAFQRSHLLYDRNAEEHYNIISALHKSIRGSDADAALYWLGRMLQGGEDPLYIARRLVRAASEDIGLADNTALPLAVSAYQACERIGMPECDTILAHLVVHLAETKKSVRVYKAYNKVKEVIAKEPNLPVPMHIRNAPTKLMKDLGYGAGYKYNPDYDEPVDQDYLPKELPTKKFLDTD